LREIFASTIRTRTRDEWSAVFEDRDACVYPVLSLSEAPHHRHNRARSSFVEVAGVMQPAPAPRFDRTPADTPSPPAEPGAHTDELLVEFGFDESAIASLRAARTVS
jgi:alpha-methylacyl-CoA racemase